MCKLLKALQDVPILSAANAHKGTQLKLNLLVEGNQSVYFKPAWYARNRVIDGPVYSGKDRHNSEIVAFYLGALLNLRWTPIAVGRAINLKEIWKLGDRELQETMIVKRKRNLLILTSFKKK
jgi:glycosaminoglycan xylosylkinase